MGGKRGWLAMDVGLGDKTRTKVMAIRRSGGNNKAMLVDVYIGQTPIEGYLNVDAILFQIGVRGARNEQGNKGENAQNEEKVQ